MVICPEYGRHAEIVRSPVIPKPRELAVVEPLGACAILMREKIYTQLFVLCARAVDCLAVHDTGQSDRKFSDQISCRSRVPAGKCLNV